MADYLECIYFAAIAVSIFGRLHLKFSLPTFRRLLFEHNSLINNELIINYCYWYFMLIKIIIYCKKRCKETN